MKFFIVTKSQHWVTQTVSRLYRLTFADCTAIPRAGNDPLFKYSAHEDKRVSAILVDFRSLESDMNAPADTPELSCTTVPATDFKPNFVWFTNQRSADIDVFDAAGFAASKIRYDETDGNAVRYPDGVVPYFDGIRFQRVICREAGIDDRESHDAFMAAYAGSPRFYALRANPDGLGYSAIPLNADSYEAALAESGITSPGEAIFQTKRTAEEIQSEYGIWGIGTVEEAESSAALYPWETVWVPFGGKED